MTITEMYKRIEQFHDFVGLDLKKPMEDEEMMQKFRNISLALFVEVSEIVSSMPWKPWKPVNMQTQNFRNFKEEVVDCFFFLVELMELLHITPMAFEEAFDMKMHTVYQRAIDHEEEYNV